MLTSPRYLILMGEKDGASRALSGFYPANKEGFEERAGAVGTITAADFEDEHKKRHLESFQKSMQEWREYEDTSEVVSDDILSFTRALITEYSGKLNDEKELEKAIKALRRRFKISPRKSQLGTALAALRSEFKENDGELQSLNRLLLNKAVRSASGVAVITVLTSPGRFSCPHDCYYCPNEPGQPRSYLSTEPAVLRGNQCGWDAAVQFWDRARTLHKNQHIVDKVEVLVLGGTWSGYSHEYQEEFCRDLFYAANEFQALMEMTNYATLESWPVDALRARGSLVDEQSLNESASVKIIGLTLETRPDYIDAREIRRLRYYGCTRVQLGVQHTDPQILAGVNRGHTIEQVARALRALKGSGYKVDIHLMPDLPHSDVDRDRKMFDEMLRNPDLQADQWKIYPCEVTPFTRISEWYRDGEYAPWSEAEPITDGAPSGNEMLITLIIQVKMSMHPWIRLNRVIRDIPNPSIIAGNSITNLRQILRQICDAHGWSCPCMRCREVRMEKLAPGKAQLVVRAYEDADATEYFLSFESANRETLFGFCRLRVPNFVARQSALSHLMEAAEKLDVASSSSEGGDDDSEIPFRVISGRCALVRELHVYGLLVGTEELVKVKDGRTQHSGLGAALLRAAEVIAVCKGATRVSVIAGVGTRNYYRRFEYELVDTYMVKSVATDVEMRAVFDAWFSDPLLREADALAVEHVDLTKLPPVGAVQVDLDRVRGVLLQTECKTAPPCADAGRTILFHWLERISIPKMTSSDHSREASGGAAPSEDHAPAIKLTDPTTEVEPDQFAEAKPPSWWSALDYQTVSTWAVAGVGVGLALYLGMNWRPRR